MGLLRGCTPETNTIVHANYTRIKGEKEGEWEDNVEISYVKASRRQPLD